MMLAAFGGLYSLFLGVLRPIGNIFYQCVSGYIP
jgi:hypothetical protein